MADLSLVLLDEIVKELEKRYDGFVFIYQKRIDKATEELHFNFPGGRALAMGLCDYAKKSINSSIVNKGDIQ